MRNDDCFSNEKITEKSKFRLMCEGGVIYKTEGLWIVQSDESAFENWLASAELGYAPA